jgi:putative transposase
MDNQKCYIYLLIDNFSRFILSHTVSPDLKASIRFHTIKQVYSTYILPHNSTRQRLDLIVDGGSENNAALINDFLARPGVSIRKIIAQQDITFSNSIIEVDNKLLKYRYLFLSPIPTIKALGKHLDKVIHEYNTIRPH